MVNIKSSRVRVIHYTSDTGSWERNVKVIGKVSKQDEKWFVESLQGKRYELVDYDMKPRMEGLTVRVIGTIEDTFGLDVLVDDYVLKVQRLNVV